MASKSKKVSPFKTGRRKSRSGGTGFVSVKPDEAVVFVPLVGMEELVSGEMHEYWEIKPAIFHPCLGKDCPGELVGNQSRWKGFLPVVVKGETEPRILAFTTSVNNQLEELEDALDDDESIAGMVIKLSRKGGGLATRYTVIGTGKRLDIDEFEVPDFIDRLGPQTHEEVWALLEENGYDREDYKDGPVTASDDDDEDEDDWS